jgi:hypothetical protein
MAAPWTLPKPPKYFGAGSSRKIEIQQEKVSALQPLATSAKLSTARRIWACSPAGREFIAAPE